MPSAFVADSGRASVAVLVVVVVVVVVVDIGSFDTVTGEHKMGPIAKAVVG